MRRLFPSLLLLVSACADPPRSPPDAAPVVDAAPSPDQMLVDAAPRSPAAREGDWLRAPAKFVQSPRETEPMAAAIAAGPGAALCGALEHDDFAALDAALAADFAGRHWSTDPVEVETVGVVTRAQFGAADPVDRAAFVARLRQLRAQFAVVERCRVKIWRFIWAAPGREWAKAQLDLRFSGRDRQGRWVQYRLDPVAELTAAPWRFRRLDLGGAERVSAASPLYADVSASVGFDLRRAASTREAIRNRIDGGQIETIGGLGVIDWNRDGRDDVMVWNQRRTLQVFVNDGVGGFDRVTNPIPPEAVGLAHLYLDLDGDNRAELVSTQVTQCADGVASLGLFRGQRTGVAPLPGRLRFPWRCAGHRHLTYQHIAAEDVDADGDLDLFFSGFSNDRSKLEGHNIFQADDGQPNLLFINEGRLRFREVAVAQGIAGEAFSYAAAFFDYDDDGDPDLYVVNDYGTNDLFLNDGRGQFTAAAPSPLTENGQSMGVMVADMDGDLDLDVYVSNMFSYAGNRIVPLFQSRVETGTFDALMALAQGNTLYRAGGGGAYEEGAAELGLQRAGWAWGQAFFDADNDGAFDVYVLNGNTSHSDARAPDY